MNLPKLPDLKLKFPVAMSFHSVINALSIPLIALLLWWALDRILTPAEWCPALEEFKSTKLADATTLRCQPILLAQLEIGKWAVAGLVGALSLSHLVSVARDVKAGIDLQTKFGSLKIGNEANAAKHVAEAAEQAAEDVVEGKAP